jgi:lysozyme
MPGKASIKPIGAFTAPAKATTPTTQKKPAVETHDGAVLLAADLCRAFEGFRARPYLCPAGIPTVGYGTTRYPDGQPVGISDKSISRETADLYLLHELTALLPWVLALCPRLSGRRLAAILDFAYNLGVGRLRASTLRKRINAGDWVAARVELLKWNKGGGKILAGLVKRREAEARLI